MSLGAAGVLNVSGQRGAFQLAANGRAASLYVAGNEPISVHKTAELFADDVERVTGLRPQMVADAAAASVVVATVGHSDYVRQLEKNRQIDLAPIRNGWEQYIIKVIGRQLIIVGSDRRGASYGLLTLSEKMGVSPWYWWADVPVARHDALYVDADYVSVAPTVKYRGVFINDEDWGLKTWAARNYERQLGDIGPRTYARVCELLLRLKANMLAPAMHSCTGAFYSHPESKVVADSFGIVITTSHCEPLLLNNAASTEWDQLRDGDWNYKTNSEAILRKWDDRLADASQYENIYTTAMRGLHDAGLRGNLPMEERVPLLAKVIDDQRALLKKHKAFTPLADSEGLGESLAPQIFVPYKETMDVYEAGLQVPDDITLVWVDDNYGYMKRVSSPAEQQRKGGAGVYYHLSYLGAPHDYLWLNTTPPVLMYEELKKAYDHGADRYWLLNVGDIKPMELGIQTFMDMAWDINAFDFDKVNRHQAEFLAKLFGGSKSDGAANNYQLSIVNYQFILDEYYRLAWSRKPEFMGWEYEWDDEAHTGLKPTEYSFDNYGEAQQRLADYQRLSDEVEAIAKNLSAHSSLFQLVQFPVQAAYQMNRKFLMAQLNGELTAQGRTAQANWAARQAEAAYDSINALNRRYNEQLGGKWRGIMALAPGWCALYQKMPEVTYHEGAGEQPCNLSPRSSRSPLKGCYAVDLSHFDRKSTDAQLVKGLGYDGQVVRLGSVTYTIPKVDADSIDVRFYTVPFWPLYKGLSNRVAVSIDGGREQVFENQFREYDRTWKDQVMRNGAPCRLTFAVDKGRKAHRLTFRALDAGQMLQRVIIDWGGLRPSYLGPAPERK